MKRSTPAVAMRPEGAYLFQSWVRISAGWGGGRGCSSAPGGGPGGGPGCAGVSRRFRWAGVWWTGISAMRWYLAETGVRRSKMRRRESEETAERRAGLWGEKATE